MLVLSTIVDIEVVEQMTAQTTLREHTLHGVLDDALGTERTLAQLGGSVEALATGITRVSGCRASRSPSCQ